MGETSLAGVRIHVHGDGDTELQGILRLIEIASASRGLTEVLNDMCVETALIAGVDVVSVYVLEQANGTDVLTMRGNQGFPASAVGTVQLQLSEGIVGFVAQCLRPVTVAVASRDARFRHVPGIGEELFPAFLGVPIVTGGDAVGVLVLQARERDRFSHRDVVLATALSAPFLAAIERSLRPSPPVDRYRTVRLTGQTIVPGTTLGRVCTVPTLSSMRADAYADAVHDIDGALDRLGRNIAMVRERLVRRGRETPTSLTGAEIALSDTRFRDHTRSCVSELGLLPGLTRVARDYAKHDERGSLGRARDIEELCVIIAALTRRIASLRQWTRDDDLVIVEATNEQILVNPSATAVAELRRTGGRVSSPRD